MSHLPLHLSWSPLLPSLGIADTENDRLALLFMKHNIPFLPRLHVNSKRKAFACTSATSLSSSTASLDITCVECSDRQHSSLISARQIISLLNLLDRMDDDVASEVHRVEEGIKEAYLLVEECKGERQMRENEWKKRQEREKTETKEADSDFWLGV